MDGLKRKEEKGGEINNEKAGKERKGGIINKKEAEVDGAAMERGLMGKLRGR